MNTSSSATVVRGIGRWDLVALMVNISLGSGILGLPARLFELTQLYSLIVLVLSGLLIGVIAICFAEVGSRFADSGGPYLIARTAFGGDAVPLGQRAVAARLNPVALVAVEEPDVARGVRDATHAARRVGPGAAAGGQGQAGQRQADQRMQPAQMPGRQVQGSDDGSGHGRLLGGAGVSPALRVG